MAREFDVWVLASNTIYKKVPFNVVTDWAQQGRLGGQDKLRPADSNREWNAVADDPIISDFLFETTKPQTGTIPSAPAVTSTDVVWRKPGEEEDDDVDMIPLIDISLVLLIFFMMSTAVSALSPVDVPQNKHAFELHANADAITITIDRRHNGDASYSLRVGDKSPQSGDGDLDTLAMVMARLDERLKDARTAPEIRIACHRELASERVHDLVKELETRKKSGKISLYRAEVNEKK